MLGFVADWVDPWIPDQTELVVHVVDSAGRPVPGASVRFGDEGKTVHSVHGLDGTFAASASYPDGWAERPFTRGTKVDVVAFSPRHKAQEVAWVSSGGWRDHLVVRLAPLSTRDFLAGDEFVFSQEALEQASSTATAPLSLLSSVGRSLARQNQALTHVLGWTHQAAEETAATYTGDAYVARMWRLHGIRAVAANEELRRISLNPEDVVGRDVDSAAWAVRRQAARLSRDWGEYAMAAGRDSSLAIDLCLAATGDAAYCPRPGDALSGS